MSLIAPIKKLVPLSLARVFATYYGFWGTVIACIYLIQLKEYWPAPVGVWTLFYFAKINFTLHPAELSFEGRRFVLAGILLCANRLVVRLGDGGNL